MRSDLFLNTVSCLFSGIFKASCYFYRDKNNYRHVENHFYPPSKFFYFNSEPNGQLFVTWAGTETISIFLIAAHEELLSHIYNFRNICGQRIWVCAAYSISSSHHFQIHDDIWHRFVSGSGSICANYTAEDLHRPVATYLLLSVLGWELPVRACLLCTESSWILGLQQCDIPRVRVRPSTSVPPFVFPPSGQQQRGWRGPSSTTNPAFLLF